jgi:Flp pilus assembly protein TadD
VTGWPFATDGRPEKSRTPVGPALAKRTVVAILLAAAVSAVAVAPSLPALGGGLEEEQSLAAACDVAVLEQVGDLDPADMPALFHRALLFWRNGDIAQARREFARVIRLKRRQVELAVEEL